MSEGFSLTRFLSDSSGTCMSGCVRAFKWLNDNQKVRLFSQNYNGIYEKEKKKKANNFSTLWCHSNQVTIIKAIKC